MRAPARAAAGRARAQREVDLSAARSAAAAAELVAAASRTPPAGVLGGGRFRHAGWPDQPTAGLLDRAAPGRVVVLRRLNMHSAWLSSAALMRCGLPDHPSGLLREHEAWAALARLPPPAATADDLAVDEVVVQPDQLADYVERGLRTGDGDAFLTVGPLKLFVDGALTTRCLTPYAGTDDRGVLLLAPDQLRVAPGQARTAGFGVAVHAIGDEATRDALTPLQGAGLPASIEHAQLLRPADLPLFAAGGVVASLQPAHLLDDAALVDDLWRDTASLPYAVASLVAAGARVVLGSDAPVSPLDPWLSIAAAVHRTAGGAPPWRPEQAVPLSPADLARVPVHATFLDGRCVHGPWE